MRVDQRTKGYKVLTDQKAAVSAHTHTHKHTHTHTHTCELQNTQSQGCTRGSRVTKVWPTTRAASTQTHTHTHTHACCSINQFKVATRDHRLHGFGRPTAAVSTQLCFADNINSGLHLKDLADQLLLHPRVKGYKSLAVQMQLRAVFDQMLL